MSRRIGLIVAVGVAAVAAGVAAVVFWGNGISVPGHPNAAQPAAVQPSVVPSSPADDAHAVASSLQRLTTDPGSLVASASKATVGARERHAVPPGSKVVVDEASWAPDGVGGGSIEVTLTAPGTPATTYVAVMVREAGGWKVLATVPVTS